jgi:hypothetical protein
VKTTVKDVKDAAERIVRDYGITYVVARKLVLEHGEDHATVLCAREAAAWARECPCGGEGLYGACRSCQRVLDRAAHESYLYGPRMLVVVTLPMLRMLWPKAVPPADDVCDRLMDCQDPVAFAAMDSAPKEDRLSLLWFGTSVGLLAHRAMLRWLESFYRSIARTGHENAPIARHAADRIHAALKGA